MRPMWRRVQRPECPQSWEIEAARDGRLSGDALTAVARHVEQCVECRELSNYFSGLGHALRELDAPTVDDAAVRRLRQTVLGAADAEMSGRSAPPTRSRAQRGERAAIVFSLVAAAVVGLAVWKQHRPSEPALVSTTTTVETVDEGGARWTQSTSAGVDWIDLTDGTLRLRVQHTPGSHRVHVRVPDGEIEDIGTTFHVVVRRGRTERVGVDEGRVTIRLANMAPITISSGATWERPEEPVAAPATVPVVSAPSSTPTPSVPTTKKTHAAPSARLVEPVDASPSASEDAVYLETISLLRAGRSVEARATAQDYLRRFPDGFRREEMLRVATP